MARIRPPEYPYYRRARDKALTRLASAYPDQYQQYLQEERANELAKRDSNSTTGATAGSVGTRASSTTTRPRSSNEGENEGNYGGEA